MIMKSTFACTCGIMNMVYLCTQLVWLTVFIATILLGVDLSLIVGICFAFMIVILKTTL